jgi:hypothetical protein
MTSPSAPKDPIVTVTTGLSQVQRKAITKFTDKNDATCIEITSSSVSSYGHFVTQVNGLYRLLMSYFKKFHNLPTLVVGSSLVVQRSERPRRINSWLLISAGDLAIWSGTTPAAASRTSIAVCLSVREMIRESDEQSICPMNDDLMPTHPFLDTAFDSLSNVLGLGEDYLRSERLQTPCLGFEVPINERESGRSGQRMIGSRSYPYRLRDEISKMGR